METSVSWICFEYYKRGTLKPVSVRIHVPAVICTKSQKQVDSWVVVYNVYFQSYFGKTTVSMLLPTSYAVDAFSVILQVTWKPQQDSELLSSGLLLSVVSLQAFRVTWWVLGSKTREGHLFFHLASKLHLTSTCEQAEEWLDGGASVLSFKSKIFRIKGNSGKCPRWETHVKLEKAAMTSPFSPH